MWNGVLKNHQTRNPVMNDKRACELLFVPYALYQLTDDASDKKSVRIRNFLIAYGAKLESDPKKLVKIHRRTMKASNNILVSISDGEKYSGHKALLVLFFLTQLIFDHKDQGRIDKESMYFIKKTKAVLDYALYLESVERFKRLSAEKDFEALLKSAQKAAKKCFQNYYLSI